MKRRRVSEDKDRELFEFARLYFSEAFPNPERQGCPPDDKLRLLAISPRESEESVGEHLAFCSPCFKAYMDHLALVKRKAHQREQIRRAAWLRRSIAALATVLVLAIAAYLFIVKHRTGPTVAPGVLPPTTTHEHPSPPQVAAAHVPVVVDLSGASPARGSNPGTARQLTLPSSLLDLTLRLPIGSEEKRYSVTLRSGRTVLWSTATQAYTHNGQTLLRVDADFTRVQAGNYSLEVGTSIGVRLRQPVLIKPAPPEGAEQRR